jgi:diadenosine tetraphosphate (Ap4A) HIT family hydrolase
MTQYEFWRSDLFGRAATLATSFGESECPNGYRILSNFGDDALQTQSHAHIHVIGGSNLGLYADFEGKDDWIRTFGEQLGLQ